MTYHKPNLSNAGEQTKKDLKASASAAGISTANRFENLHVHSGKRQTPRHDSLNKRKPTDKNTQSVASQKFDALFGGGDDSLFAADDSKDIKDSLMESLAPADAQKSRKSSNVDKNSKEGGSRKQSNVSSGADKMDRKLA